MQKYRVKDRMYGEKIFLLVSNKQDFLDYCKNRYKAQLYEPNGNACYFYFNNEHVLWVEKFDWTIAEQALLLHEILHLCFQVLRDRGFILVKESEEAYTYYTQDIMSAVWSKLAKMHKGYEKEKSK